MPNFKRIIYFCSHIQCIGLPLVVNLFTLGDAIIFFKFQELGNEGSTLHIKKITMKFHGTKYMPAHYKKKRQYAAFRLHNDMTSLDWTRHKDE